MQKFLQEDITRQVRQVVVNDHDIKNCFGKSFTGSIGGQCCLRTVAIADKVFFQQ